MRHFTLIVAGDNPEELVKPYNSNIKVEPYVLYEFKKAGVYHQNMIKTYEEMLKLDKFSPKEKDIMQKQLDFYKSEDDVDFFLDMTEGLDIDDETGNVMSTENKDGKYTSCNIGKNLSMPMKDVYGKETFKERKSDIDWGAIHLNNQEVYKIVWDMCVEGKEPTNDDEKQLYENMKNRKEYFRTFGDRDTYVKSNTAFWGYAFLSKETGWVELDGKTDQNQWISNFYERFIMNLPEDTLISVWECIR